MSQKNLLLLMLSCTIIFVTFEYSIGGGSWYFKPSPRGGSGNVIPIAREGHIIFSAQFKICNRLLSPPPPLIISDKSLVLSYCILTLFMVCCFVEGFSNFLPEPLVWSDDRPVENPSLFIGVRPE